MKPVMKQKHARGDVDLTGSTFCMRYFLHDKRLSTSPDPDAVGPPSSALDPPSVANESSFDFIPIVALVSAMLVACLVTPEN